MLPNTTIRFNHSQNTQPVRYTSQLRSIQPQHIPAARPPPPIQTQTSSFRNLQPYQEIPLPLMSPQLKSEISFGNNYHTQPPQQNKISFSRSQDQWNSSRSPSARIAPLQPQQYKRPELVENPQKLLEGAGSNRPSRGQVKTFNVDTTDIQTLKENQFTGCFHCFYPVSYSTKNKGLC